MVLSYKSSHFQVGGKVARPICTLDGSCNSLFGGCVNTSFDFHSLADAIGASQALFTQVINGFGNHPDKILAVAARRVSSTRLAPRGWNQ